jgi:hypothetical protein
VSLRYVLVRINTGQPKSGSNTGAVFWAVLATVCLGTTLGLWLMGPDTQPSNFFGQKATVAVLAATLFTLVVASATRKATKGFRWTVCFLAVALAMCSGIVALGYFNAARGSADAAIGSMLTLGTVATLAVAISSLRGR